MRNRMSILPVAQFCGLASRLAAQHGAGRAAALSTAFHAICAGEDETTATAGLTDDECQELLQLHPPVDVEVNGVTLRYPEAKHEVEVKISIDDEFCVGHVDGYWVMDDIAYVADIKLTRWASKGPNTLQLLAYGMAVAETYGCHAFYTGIWAATEGEWNWSQVHDVWKDGPRIYAQIAHASTNNSDTGDTGPHCSDCYNRLHCPEYLLPVSRESWLAPLSRDGELTNDIAREMLERVERAERVVKAAKSSLREYARRIGGIGDPASGLVWRPYEVKGKASTISVKEVRERFPALANELIKSGAPYARYGWRKA